MKPLVSIVMGSISDLSIMEKAKGVLAEFGVPYEIRILSAHRSPKETALYAKNLVRRGIKVVIAGAGGAAHLPGVIASLTTIPVIGVPIYTAPFKGLDSVLSILQMPQGVPVATVNVDGAANAGILAIQILGRYKKKLAQYKKELVKKVKLAQQKINQ